MRHLGGGGAGVARHLEGAVRYTLVWPLTGREEGWSKPTRLEAILEGRRRYPHFWTLLSCKKLSDASTPPPAAPR